MGCEFTICGFVIRWLRVRVPWAAPYITCDWSVIYADRRWRFIFCAIGDREAFHERWGKMAQRYPEAIPACMGYKLSAEENPFGTGTKDLLY